MMRRWVVCCDVDEAEMTDITHVFILSVSFILHHTLPMTQIIAVQKKLKALRKKLRDIADLEAKKEQGEKLSAEQKEKVGRRQSVEDDIAEMEEEEDLLGE